MTTKKTRNPSEREWALEQVATFFARGYSQIKIAQATGRSYPQITYDMKILRDRWKDRAFAAIDRHIAEEIKKLDEVEATYWSAYEASKYDSTGHIKLDSAGNSKQGNTIHLAGVLQCIEKRTRILGIFEKRHGEDEKGMGTLATLTEAIRLSREAFNNEAAGYTP